MTPPEVSRPVCEICDRPMSHRDLAVSHWWRSVWVHESCCPRCAIPQEGPDQ
jgi:hypothetical protein